MKALYALGFVALLGCQSAAPPLEAPTVERWAPVRAATEPALFEGPARVAPSPLASSVVTPAFRATVTRLRVREGDVVDAGAPLVDVLMPELLDAAGRAEGARARLTAWAERQQQLTALRADGLARSLDVSEAAARVAEARADLQAARAVLLSAGLREGDGAALLSGAGTLSLRAPQAGVVTRLTATLGENRDPTAGPLAFISSTGPARVEGRLPGPVTDGTWHFVDGAGRRHALRLVSRAPAADARDGSFLAWFEPTDAALVPGTPGRVERQGSTAAARFLVPATVLRRDEAGSMVTSRRGAVRVTVSRCESEDCVVEGALTTADELLVRPAP